MHTKAAGWSQNVRPLVHTKAAGWSWNARPLVHMKAAAGSIVTHWRVVVAAVEMMLG